MGRPLTSWPSAENSPSLSLFRSLGVSPATITVVAPTGMQRTSAASTICVPSDTRHVALVSSGHGASSLQQSHPCALPMSSVLPTYQ